jgi:hypothetical protein
VTGIHVPEGSGEHHGAAPKGDLKGSSERRHPVGGDGEALGPEGDRVDGEVGKYANALAAIRSDVEERKPGSVRKAAAIHG